MSYTETQLSALRTAYASGATEVSYEGKTIKYRSLKELGQAIARVEASLKGAAPSRQHYPTFSKGI